MAVKTETLKVSEMAKAKRLDDSSLFLVVQNGHGSKLTFADLKNAVIEEVRKELEQQHKDIDRQKKFQDAFDARIEAIVQSKLSEFSDSIVASVRQTLDNSKKQMSLSIERYHRDAQESFGKLKKDIDADNLPKLFTKSTDLSRKISHSENARKKIAEEMTASIEKLKKDLDSKIEEAEEKLSEKIQQESSKFKKIEADAKSANDKAEQLDAKLYGVVVEEVDANTAEVTETHLKEGDVTSLAEAVRKLTDKVDQLSKKIQK